MSEPMTEERLRYLEGAAVEEDTDLEEACEEIRRLRSELTASDALVEEVREALKNARAVLGLHNAATICTIDAALARTPSTALAEHEARINQLVIALKECLPTHFLLTADVLAHADKWLAAYRRKVLDSDWLVDAMQKVQARTKAEASCGDGEWWASIRWPEWAATIVRALAGEK